MPQPDPRRTTLLIQAKLGEVSMDAILWRVRAEAADIDIHALRQENAALKQQVAKLTAPPPQEPPHGDESVRSTDT